MLIAFCFKYSVGLEYPEYRGAGIEETTISNGWYGFTVHLFLFALGRLMVLFGRRRQKPWSRLNDRIHLSVKSKLVTRLFFGALFFWSCTFAFPCAAYDPLKGHGKAGPMWRVLLALGLAVCDGEDERRWVSLLFVKHFLLIWAPMKTTNNICYWVLLWDWKYCQIQWNREIYGCCRGSFLGSRGKRNEGKGE